MPDDEDRAARYADILKRIEQRKQHQSSAPVQSLLSIALDGLNAAGLLTAIKRRPPEDMSAYGPKTFSGSVTPPKFGDTTIPEQWVGSVMWHKPKGYSHYRTLRLLGIWALGKGTTTRIVIGEKRLTFNAPVFNPESYYHHIKRKFDIFYEGNARPPLKDSEGRLLYDAIYHEGERLETRSTLRGVLREWIDAYKPDMNESDSNLIP
ncbi:MAG: hypothetical protein ABI970_17845 [Chloroflexota bacterium]